MDKSSQINFLPHEELNNLIQALNNAGYPCVGPQLRDGAIVYEPLNNAKQLPWGIVDHQAPGEYRIEETGQKHVFAWVNGPQAVKPLLFKPRESLWKVGRNTQGKLEFTPVEVEAETCKQTLFAIRPCDLHALLIQDKVFIQDTYQDKRYATRRDNVMIVVANCTTSSNNCFCISAGGDTKASANFDIALTEVATGFVVETASERGRHIIKQLNLAKADDHVCQQAQQYVARAAQMQTKHLPGKNLRDPLMNNLDHPRWQEVASRCLSCGNCTQVCPTCFCHDEVENPSLTGESSEHVREWDSCFTHDHSYIHGKVIRENTEQRYRQWLTHKLGTWHDQFGTSGCVGCGRCVTWCPVGIDITEEATAICGSEDG